MRNPSHADQYLARLLQRPAYRVTIYTVLIVTATAILYLKVIEGRADPRPPSYLGLLSLYGLVMMLLARDIRCRIAYFSFGVLVATVYARSLLSGHPVATGLIQVAACLALLAALRSLARDPGFQPANPVLQSGTRNPAQILEDPDAQARADRPTGRDTRHEPGGGQGQGTGSEGGR